MNYGKRWPALAAGKERRVEPLVRLGGSFFQSYGSAGASILEIGSFNVTGSFRDFRQRAIKYRNESGSEHLHCAIRLS